MAEPLSKFRVIIVGGSIAGLTLAHCLDRCNIDYIVLEGNAEIAPQVGASIGILTNGSRILDQLGIIDDILDEVEPLRASYIWSDAGSLITDSDSPEEIHRRHGYPTSFLDRQLVLEILHRRLGSSQNKVFLGKKVTSVESLPSKAVVHCADGSVFEGDLVVGADGVRSTVRRQMWEYMDANGLGDKAAKDREAMTSEYSCVFGISTPVEGLIPGDGHRTYAEGYSTLTIVGKEGRVFWFFFTKMDQIYPANAIPRFSKDDLESHVAKYSDKPITGTVSLDDVYKNVTSKTFVALEEASYDTWHAGRMLCAGDSIHKMTPNMGQGGNSAIETVAALANTLNDLLKAHSNSKPTQEEIDCHLAKWQSNRQERAQRISVLANDMTRLEAGATLKHRILGQKILPYLGDALVNKMSATFMGAQKIDFLPEPLRASQAPMPISGSGLQTPSLVSRLLDVTPLVGCFAAAKVTLGAGIGVIGPVLAPVLGQGTWKAPTGEVLSLTKQVFPISMLDKIFQPVILTLFLPSLSGSDPVSRSQMSSFLADLGPIYGIWLLESYRMGQSWGESLIPIVLGCVFQLKGIGLIAPIYYLQEYLRKPSSALLDGKHGFEPETLVSFSLAMVAGYYLPTIANFTAPSVESRRSWNALWQLFPVVIPLLQAPLTHLAKSLSRRLPSKKENSKRKDEKKRNMTYTRCVYNGLALISATTFIYTRFTLPANTSMWSTFLPKLGDHALPVSSFQEGIARFLQYDQLLASSSSIIWTLLKLRELKQMGVSTPGWKMIGSLVGGISVFGPGATFALGWGWREEMLARLRERRSV